MVATGSKKGVIVTEWRRYDIQRTVLARTVTGGGNDSRIAYRTQQLGES